MQLNINVGDLLLLLESQTEGKRDYWKVLVVETYPDVRGCICSLKIRISDGRMIRRDLCGVVHLEEFISVS